MNNTASILYRSVLALFVFILAFTLPAGAATNARMSESYGKLPLQFEANRGQTHKDVRFLSRGPGYSLYLTAGETVLVLSQPKADAKRDAQALAKSVALRMSLVGAARKPAVSGTDELPGKANYFIGKDRSKWRTDVPTYAKVRYREVYPGIDLVYYGKQRQLEYDFVVAPGADPKKIVLGFKGADKLEIDAQGDLVLHAADGDVRQHKPVVYQDIDGVRREIDGSYVRKGANRVGFQLAAYDTARPLIIDPVLSYSTYLGGSSGESPGASGQILSMGVAVDAAGNAYVTGATASFDFPTTAGAFQTTLGSTQSGFVTKLDPSGSGLVYSTYIGGGDGFAEGTGIAVGADGNAYVTGVTSSNTFPTTTGASQTTFGGFFDAFVVRLDPRGSALVYSTYLGGTDIDLPSGIAVDASGNTYITGATRSLNFPVTPGAFQTTFNNGLRGSYNAFVTKLDGTGSVLVYSTYLGGIGGSNNGGGVAVDAGGNAYVTGFTSSSSFPTTPGAFQPVLGGPAGDAFVTKLNPAGSGIVYSTYLGGSGTDGGSGIALDANGNAYVTGTTSGNFPTTAGAFQRTFGGGNADAFVTKLNPAGGGSADLVYSTYLGGSGDEFAKQIAVDANGSAYLTGSTVSADFPVTAGAFQPTFAGRGDAFVTKLDQSGSALVYSTYLGGSDNEVGYSIAVDASCNAYVTGTTNSNNFPTTPGAFQTTFGGGPEFSTDAFVARVADDASPCTANRSEESAATEIGFWTTYGAETGTFSGGTIVASNVAASTAMFSFTGTAVSWIGVKCNVCGIAAVSIDGGVPTTVNTAGPNAPGSLTSESVFSASGLAAANHTIAITVTGMSSSGGAYVAVDAFDVISGGGTSPLVPPVVLPPPPVVVPSLPPIVGL